MQILVVDDQPTLCDALTKYLEPVAPQVATTPITRWIFPIAFIALSDGNLM